MQQAVGTIGRHFSILFFCIAVSNLSFIPHTSHFILHVCMYMLARTHLIAGIA